MRRGMIDAMTFWVKDIGIDGFRVDVAHGVPLDFWEECNQELYQIKSLFMLAEAAIPDRRNSGGFVMDYGWEMHHLLNEIAKYQGANHLGLTLFCIANYRRAEGYTALCALERSLGFSPSVVFTLGLKPKLRIVSSV